MKAFIQIKAKIQCLPAAEVVGVDVLAVVSASSSNRACSGLVTDRVGGAGARRLFERRFLSKIGKPDT